MCGDEQRKMALQRYGDIIERAHHRSANRKPLSMVDRAAQFSPFAALTGHGAAIRETARLTESGMELTEDARAMLDQKLDILLHADRKKTVVVTFFEPDERKAGGAYVSHTGMFRRVDAMRRLLLLTDGTEIPLDRIVSMELLGQEE